MKKFPYECTDLESGRTFIPTIIDFENQSVWWQKGQASGNGVWVSFEEVSFKRNPEFQDLELLNGTWDSFEEPPYLLSSVTEVIRKYNPKYGDNRICECGHSYERHFDTYDDMEVVGCKYCECETFVEDKKYKAFKEAIDDAWEKYNMIADIVEMTEADAKAFMHNVMKKLMDVDYNKVIVEITPINSVAFKLIFYEGDDKVVAIIDEPFVKTDEIDRKIIFSFLHNGEVLLIDYTLDWDEIIKGLMQVRKTLKED